MMGHKPLSEGKWELALDSVHFGLYCQNDGVGSFTKVGVYPSLNNLYTFIKVDSLNVEVTLHLKF